MQQGRGLRQLSRFELKSQVGDATFTLIEINDGRFFWTFRELPGGPSLNRLDLDRIESQLRSADDRAPPRELLRCRSAGCQKPWPSCGGIFSSLAPPKLKSASGACG